MSGRYGGHSSLSQTQAASDSISDDDLYGENSAIFRHDSNTDASRTGSSLSDNLLAKLMGSRTHNPGERDPMQLDGGFSHYSNPSALSPLRMLDYQYQQRLRSQLEPKQASYRSLPADNNDSKNESLMMKYDIPESKPSSTTKNTFETEK